MKIVQEKYWAFIKMLENLNSENEIVIECLSQKLEELSFDYFKDDSKTSKKYYCLFSYLTSPPTIV